MSESWETPLKIKLDNPHPKIVFALRDPVERAISDYRFNLRDYKGLVCGGFIAYPFLPRYPPPPPHPHPLGTACPSPSS